MVNNASKRALWSSLQPDGRGSATMNLTLRFALSLAALAPFAAAHAADYDPPIYVEEAAEYVPVEVGSGWYLRGDVGYVFDASIGEVNYTTFDGALRPRPLSPRRRSTPTSHGAAASATASPTIFAPTRRSTATGPISAGPRQAPIPALPIRSTARPAVPRTEPRFRPSASWPTAMSISAPMSGSRPMSERARDTAISAGAT